MAVAAGILGAIPAVALAGWLRGQFVGPRGCARDLHAVGEPLRHGAGRAGGSPALAAGGLGSRRGAPPGSARPRRSARPRWSLLGWACRLVAGLAVLVLSAGLLVLSTQLRGEALRPAAPGVVRPTRHRRRAAARSSPASPPGPERTAPEAVLHHRLPGGGQHPGELPAAGRGHHPLILALGVGGVTLFQYTTLRHAAERQAKEGMLGDRSSLPAPCLRAGRHRPDLPAWPRPPR